jgi:tripartite-type tricarboxylate transporter receptor subunit TctC
MFVGIARLIAPRLSQQWKQPIVVDNRAGGAGSPQQLGMELLKQMAGIYLTHIPYRGGPLGMQDVIAGQVGRLSTRSHPRARASCRRPPCARIESDGSSA